MYVFEKLVEYLCNEEADSEGGAREQAHGVYGAREREQVLFEFVLTWMHYNVSHDALPVAPPPPTRAQPQVHAQPQAQVQGQPQVEMQTGAQGEAQTGAQVQSRVSTAPHAAATSPFIPRTSSNSLSALANISSVPPSLTCAPHFTGQLFLAPDEITLLSMAEHARLCAPLSSSFFHSILFYFSSILLFSHPIRLRFDPLFPLLCQIQLSCMRIILRKS